MKISAESTIGEIVAEDYRASEIFRELGIDFCCKGNRKLSSVCDSMGLDPEKIIGKITNSVMGNTDGLPDFKTWPLDLLADYVEKKHHRYVEERIPVINQYLDKICQVHGDRHPELFEISKEFRAAGGELAMHMKKEELVLFPWIRKMVANPAGITAPHFGTVKNPVEMMMKEHDTEGDRFRRIVELSNNYQAPEDSCNTYRVTFSLLKEFEEDLHLHIHLENNILFPGAIELEKKVLNKNE